MKEYGLIVGQSNPGFYEFNIIDPDNRPVTYEYVQVDVEEVKPDGSREVHQVLGQVKSLMARHPFYDQRTSPGAAWRQRELGVSDDLKEMDDKVKQSLMKASKDMGGSLREAEMAA